MSRRTNEIPMVLDLTEVVGDVTAIPADAKPILFPFWTKQLAIGLMLGLKAAPNSTEILRVVATVLGVAALKGLGEYTEFRRKLNAPASGHSSARTKAEMLDEQLNGESGNEGEVEANVA